MKNDSDEKMINTLREHWPIAADRIAELQARVHELEKDRERLDFVCNGLRVIDKHVESGRYRLDRVSVSYMDLNNTAVHDDIRSAIDAAMQKEAE